MRTFSPKTGDVQRQWHVIDASDVVLGRLASQVATLLRGKHKPVFAPHLDTGDFVIVVNASKVALTGTKLRDKRLYRHSGYPGGISSKSYEELLAKHPERIVESAVRHAAEDLARPWHAAQAEGVRGPGPPARGAAAHPLHHRPDRADASRHPVRPVTRPASGRGSTS